MMMKKLSMIVVLSIMVAVVVAPDSSGSAPQVPSEKEFNVGRAFAHCRKLTKDNYDIWFTGLISTLAGISGISTLVGVKKFFNYFEKNGGKDLAIIEAALRQLQNAYDDICVQMFTIIQTTIDGDKEPSLAKTATQAK